MIFGSGVADGENAMGFIRFTTGGWAPNFHWNIF